MFRFYQLVLMVFCIYVLTSSGSYWSQTPRRYKCFQSITNPYSIQRPKVVAPGVNLLHLCPLWRVSSDATRKTVLRQRRKQQMDGNTCANCRLPNPPSLLLHLSIKETFHKQQYPLKATKICLNRLIGLHLSRRPKWSRLPFSLHWSLPPSCFHLLPHLRNPIVIHRLLLVLPQLAEIHSLRHQFPSASHNLLCTSNFPGRLCRLIRRSPEKETCSRVHLHRLCLGRVRFGALLDTVCNGECHEEGDFLSNHGHDSVSVNGRSLRRSGGAIRKRGLEGFEARNGGVRTREIFLCHDLNMGSYFMAAFQHWSCGTHSRGVVALLQYHQCFEPPHRSGFGRDLLPRQNWWSESDSHGFGHLGTLVMCLSALYWLHKFQEWEPNKWHSRNSFLRRR